MNRQITTWAIGAIALLSVGGGGVVAQAPEPGAYSAAKYSVQYALGNRVAMRDGVTLSVDIYRPKDDGSRFPALLTITPYNNNGGWQERAKWFAKRGYVVALADTRGRYDSEGTWDPYNLKQKADGYELVEWLAKQSWCNGRVGMYGPSYMGLESWWTATQAPPSLKAIVPEVAPPDQMRNTPYQDGVLVGWQFAWEAENSGRTAQVPGDGGHWSGKRLADDLKHTPYNDLNKFRGLMDAPWFDVIYRDNLSTAEYWTVIAYQTADSYSKVTVPSLAVSGWFDANHPGAPMNYIAMKHYGATSDARRPRLVIGPWTHWPVATRELAGIDYGADAALDWDGYVTRFFDHFLKGVDNGIQNDPPVHIFVMGANKWRAAPDWPLPQTRWTKYYFDSQGKANSLKGDGLLTLKHPQGKSVDTYVYDPANPTLSPDSPATGILDGAVDTRLSAIRDDVLVYQTPPLKSALEVVGPIEAKLYASTSAHDTDWYVRLTDVQPDGRSLLLADGALRARSRDPDRHGRFTSTRLNDIEPDRVYEYTVEFWRGTGNVFLPGHRIRVEISSSWYPYFVPNLNTGADNLADVLMSEAVVARQTIYHGSKYPSYILLPVIPAGQ